jgi:TolB-like protein/Tfp pilus assembly protein PilF
MPDYSGISSGASNGSVRAAAIAAELAHILSSEAFIRSERQQRFLRFIVEETVAGRDLNEYRIATEVFGRKPSFDPGSDSIVRVEAGRLRLKLAEYYRSEGQNRPIKIELPARTYVPLFHETTVPELPEPPATTPRTTTGSLWGSARRIIPISALLILAVLAWFALRSSFPLTLFGSRAPVANAGTISIAVLPFVDLSQAKDQAYFADGLSEEIIEALGAVPGLSVVSRTSSFAYRGKTEDIRSIGKALNATVVLEGSLRYQEGRVRVTAQLIDASNGYHRWSHTYERSHTDPFSVEREIAGGIAKSLGHELAPSRMRRQQSQYAPTLDTYNIYLQGLHYSHRWSSEGLSKAVQLFGQAVAGDPNFAAAWAALAETECVLAIHAGFPPNEAMPKAKQHALRALQLDDGLSTAHASIGLISGVYEWDWARAGAELTRAHEMDPADAGVHEAYIMGFLVPTGRLDQALAEADEARQLDPVSARISSVAAMVRYFRRDYDGALSVLRKTLELEPQFYSARLAIGSVYEEKGMFDQAITELRAGQGEWQFGVGRSALGYTYARMGMQAEAQAILKELTAASQKRYISPTHIAAIHLALGHRDLAFQWLDKAYEQRSSSLAMLRVNPRFDSLRSNPRFVELLKKIGLGG